MKSTMKSFGSIPVAPWRLLHRIVRQGGRQHHRAARSRERQTPGLGIGTQPLPRHPKGLTMTKGSRRGDSPSLLEINTVIVTYIPNFSQVLNYWNSILQFLLVNVNPGSINPKRLLNWEGTIEVSNHDYSRSTPLIHKPWFINPGLTL